MPYYTLERPSISKEDIDLVLKALRLPVILAVILDIAVFFTENVLWWTRIINILAFILLAYFLVRRQLTKFSILTLAGILTGLVIGFLVGLFKIVWFKNAWLIFELIALPLRWAFLGAIILVLSGYFLKFILRPKRKHFSHF